MDISDTPPRGKNPGDRIWNRNAHKRLHPADEPGPHPYFDRVLRHSFSDLNDWLKGHSHIPDGYHYALLWIAIALYRVFQSLETGTPYRQAVQLQVREQAPCDDWRDYANEAAAFAYTLTA